VIAAGRPAGALGVVARTAAVALRKDIIIILYYYPADGRKI